MPYSIVIDGKVFDYQFEKRPLTNSYVFRINNVYVGQLFKVKKGSWSVVGKTPNPLCPIHGLKSRLDAVELLLKLEGYRKKMPRTCPECKGKGLTDNHVTGEVECSMCEGTGVLDELEDES